MSESCISSEIKRSALAETPPFKLLIIRILNYHLKGNQGFWEWSVGGGRNPEDPPYGKR